MAGWIGLIRCENDNKLIIDYVISHVYLALNRERGRGIKMLSKRVKKIEEELLDREILTLENIESIGEEIDKKVLDF